MSNGNRSYSAPAAAKSVVPNRDAPSRAAAPSPNVQMLSAAGLKALGGSAHSDRFNNQLVNAALAAAWWPTGASEDDRNKIMSAVVCGMMAFKPADEIEGMVAAQATAMHHGVMECARRAMIPDQPFEVAQGYRKAAANMSRTFTELLSALDRKRGKGAQQKVTVEHVHVHAGGQAIVGAVAPGAPTRGGGGDRGQARGEPQGTPPGLAHDPTPGAVLCPLRSQDPQRDAVPLSSGAGEGAMSPARRA